MKDYSHIPAAAIRQSRIAYSEEWTPHTTDFKQTFFFSKIDDSDNRCPKQEAGGITLISMPTDENPTGQLDHAGWAPKGVILNWQEL